MDELLQQNSTSFYVFDTDEAVSRTARIREYLGSNIRLAYAVKANPFITRALIPYVERFEVCSPGESAICDKAGVPPEKSVISGVYKTPSFIESLISSTSGRVYTVESMSQFSLLASLAEKYGKKIQVLLRLTNSSQFGISEEELRGIISSRTAYPLLDIAGIQYFSGTQKTSVKKLRREIAALDALLISLRESFGYEAPELEYGTGFPAAYFEGVDDICDEIVREFASVLSEMAFKPTITLELGRSIAAACGRYFTPVVDIKRNNSQNYLIVEGGMHHMVYFGQYMGMKHPLMYVCGKENEACTEQWNICGSLCSMNDILAKQMPLPPVERGDWLCFRNTGAYCMTEGISLFLSRELPAVYLQEKASPPVLARRPFETYVLNCPDNF